MVTLRKRRRGFTLLEVMVSIAILGLAMTVILSAQGDCAVKDARAANIGEAITIGRCRMAEIEEKLAKFGYAQMDEIDSNTICCDDREVKGYSCDWRIEKVLLPSPPQNSIDGGSLSLGGILDGGSAVSLPPGAMTAAANPLGGATLDFDAGLAGIGTSMMTQFGGAGGAQGMLSMVFGIVYPSLKPVLEMTIRRITVTIKWREGLKARELPLVQFVTNPSMAGLLSGYDGGLGLEGGAGGATGGGATTTGGAAGVAIPKAQNN
jgi:general secretion pathway protein I